MSSYSFELIEDGEVTTLKGAALSDLEAEHEAVRFIGEVLRDRSTVKPGSVCVTLLKDEKPHYRVETTILKIA